MVQDVSTTTIALWKRVQLEITHQMLVEEAKDQLYANKKEAVK